MAPTPTLPAGCRSHRARPRSSPAAESAAGEDGAGPQPSAELDAAAGDRDVGALEVELCSIERQARGFGGHLDVVDADLGQLVAQGHLRAGFAEERQRAIGLDLKAYPVG